MKRDWSTNTPICSGIPRDSRENAVQICPICKFQATTKNPYRHLQDHLARVHFKERIAAELPTKKPYICPEPGCEGKQYPDWQVGPQVLKSIACQVREASKSGLVLK